MLDRRGFVKFVAGGAVGTLLSPMVFKITDDISIWSQNWPWIPKNVDGVSEYVPTVSKLCPSGCGLSVRTVGGRPVKVEGLPGHPLSDGKMSALAAAEVQMLYSPARLKRPLRRSSDGAMVSVTWEEAAHILEEKLGSIKGTPGKLAVLSGDENGTANEVLSAFAAGFGSEDFFLMPGEAQPAAKAWSLMGGSGQVGYDIENSDFVLAIGADFLESWGAVIRNRRAFSETHPHGEEPSAKYVYAGPVQGNTAAGCDQWIPVRPGTEAVFALGLANALVGMGAYAYADDFQSFKGLIAGFTEDKVEQVCGTPSGLVKMLAAEMKKADKPLVLAGSGFAQGAGAATVLAGLALNALLGRIGEEGGITPLQDFPQVVEGAASREAMLEADFLAWLAKVGSGEEKPEVLLIHEANPVYALPQAARTAEVLAHIPFKVSFTSFLDETAKECDLVLPVPMGLERWDDVASPYGVGRATYSVAVPVADPVYKGMPAADFLFALGRKFGVDLGFSSMKEVVEAKTEAIGADFDSLTDGEAYVSDETDLPGTLALRADILAEAAGGETDAAFPVALAPVNKLNIGTRYVATPPANLKTIRENELLGTEFFVHMNRKTAASAGVGEGSRILLKSAAGECRARVHISESVMTGVAAAPLGFGHTASDDYSRGKGDNVAKLLAVGTEPATGISVWNGVHVSIAKI